MRKRESEPFRDDHTQLEAARGGNEQVKGRMLWMKEEHEMIKKWNAGLKRESTISKFRDEERRQDEKQKCRQGKSKDDKAEVRWLGAKRG